MKFQVRVLGLPEGEMESIIAVRAVGPLLGLAEAAVVRDMIRQQGSVVMVAGISRASAEDLALDLQRAGAEASVEPSQIPQPMLIRPKADERYEVRRSWIGLRMKRKTLHDPRATH